VVSKPASPAARDVSDDGSPAEATAEWWARLGVAVNGLARRYPRTYGMTIPASWRDDLETVELLFSITTWRQELDAVNAEPDHEGAGEREMLRMPESGLARARQQWEWHAHRDEWLARLAETGREPLCADPRETAR
jgi:hypothetical protein